MFKLIVNLYGQAYQQTAVKLNAPNTGYFGKGIKPYKDIFQRLNSMCFHNIALSLITHVNPYYNTAKPHDA